MKKGVVILAVVLTALGLGLSGFAIISFGFDFTELDTHNYEIKEYEIEESFTDISISVKEADVTVLPSEDDKTKVVCREREDISHAVTVESGTLKIVLLNTVDYWDFLTFSFKEQSVTVYLPTEFYRSVVIDASTGDINIKGVTAENINLSVSTGDVAAEDLICNNFTSDGSTGDVTLKNVVAAENFFIERSTGDVEFYLCDGLNMTVKTSTGDVTGKVVSDKVFTVSSSTGNVRVPKSSGTGKCEVRTSTGDIIIETSAE